MAGFGRLMARAESALYRDSRAAGALYAAVGAGVGVTAGLVCPSVAVMTYAVSASTGLTRAAESVAAALADGDLAAARNRLPALVGRDPTDLDEAEVARAVIESVAENTVDAVVAPALWAVVGGAPAAAAYRAVNTLDAMVGHRSERYERFGWASARLDDAAGYLPARATALLVAAVRPRRAGDIWRAVRRDAPAHPSPNAGVAEAAFAAALGLRLGGPTVYRDRVDPRPRLGDGRPPRPSDIGPAVSLCSDVTAALTLALLGIGAAASSRS